MSEPLVLSGSSLSTYLRCGMQWEFAYVKRIRRPPRVRMVVGTATHEAVEVNYRHKREMGEDLPLPDVLDAYSTAFDREVVEAEDDEDKGEAKDQGIVLTSIYQKEVAPTVWPVMVEEQIQADIDGIPYSGFLDVTDHNNRIRDTKTSGRRPVEDTYKLSMTGYAILFRYHTQTMESGITLDYLIRTKKPYYLPVEGGAVDDGEINRFANVLQRVAGSIETGSFPPNGLINGSCSWCGYADICPAYRATR
ncbi:MAG: PD-(D/E)XK nuclease family protein [Deltaproteobacteria bacterium]|nr:PD-(D/E)XK nuclease family protein [Deltaproteobacteria bacterium]